MKQIYKFYSQKVKVALRILLKTILYGIIAIRLIYKLLLGSVSGIIQVYSIILNKFNKFFSFPQVVFCRNMIIKLLSGYLALYTVAFSRYQFYVLDLGNEVTSLVTSSKEENPKFAFERIHFLQKENVPVEPIFFQLLSVWKSFDPKYNQVNIKIFKKLRLLIANKKQNDTDFSKSYFHNIKFLNANLSLTNFLT